MYNLRNYLDILFAELPYTPETARAKQQLYEMMEDKYNDLLLSGMTSEEAERAVKDEFGNLDEVAESLGLSDVIKKKKKFSFGGNTQNYTGAYSSMQSASHTTSETRNYFEENPIPEKGFSKNPEPHVLRTVLLVIGGFFLFVCLLLGIAFIALKAMVSRAGLNLGFKMLGNSPRFTVSVNGEDVVTDASLSDIIHIIDSKGDSFELFEDEDIDDSERHNLPISEFDSVEIDTTVGDVEIRNDISDEAYSTGFKDDVVKATIDNGVLKITNNYKARFKEDTKNKKIVVVTSHDLKNVTIKTNMGDIRINRIAGKSLKLDTDMGDIELNDSIFDKLDLNTSMGDIDIEAKTFFDKHSLDLSTSLGDIEVFGKDKGESHKKDGVEGKRIKARTSMGDIEISR